MKLFLSLFMPPLVLLAAQRQEYTLPYLAAGILIEERGLHMLTEEQVADRVNYIGGADIASVLGLSRWGSQLRIWALKTGAIPPDDLTDNQAVEFGNELEDVVARAFTRRTGKKVQRVNEAIVHPSYPFLRGHIDRKVVGADEIVEAKTCSAWRAQEFKGEDMPAEYILQAMYYLALTGKSVCHVACLIGGQDFRIKTVLRDDNLIKDILRKAVRFWKDFVEPKIMPGPVTKNDGETLYQLFPAETEEEPLELGDEANRVVEQRKALLADKKTVEGQLDLVDNQLKALLKERALGVTDKYRVTWRAQQTLRLDSIKLKEERFETWQIYAKPSLTRVLRVSALKGK